MSDSRLFMEVLVKEMKRMVRAEFEPLHKRLDRLEKSMWRQPQNDRYMHRRERIQPREVRFEDEKYYGDGFDRHAEYDDYINKCTFMFNPSANTPAPMTPKQVHQKKESDKKESSERGAEENNQEREREAEKKGSQERERLAEKNESEQKEKEREKKEKSQEKERMAEKKKNEREKDAAFLTNPILSSSIISPMQVFESIKGQHKLSKRHLQRMEFIKPIPFVIKYKQRQDLRTNPFQEGENDGRGATQDSQPACKTREQYSKDPFSLPSGPITRFRAKHFREALNSLIQQVRDMAYIWRPGISSNQHEGNLVTMIKVLEGLN